MREILSAIAAETGRKVPHVIKPRRAGDPTYLVADPTAARETLKFRPAHSDLATIIRTAWAWHSKAHPLKTEEPLRAGGEFAAGCSGHNGLICSLLNVRRKRGFSRHNCATLKPRPGRMQARALHRGDQTG